MLRALSQRLGIPIIVWLLSSNNVWLRHVVAPWFHQGYAQTTKDKAPVVVVLKARHYRVLLKTGPEVRTPDAWYQETPQRPPSTFKGAGSDCGLSLPGSTPSKCSCALSLGGSTPKASAAERRLPCGSIGSGPEIGSFRGSDTSTERVRSGNSGRSSPGYLRLCLSAAFSRGKEQGCETDGCSEASCALSLPPSTPLKVPEERDKSVQNSKALQALQCGEPAKRCRLLGKQQGFLSLSQLSSDPGAARTKAGFGLSQASRLGSVGSEEPDVGAAEAAEDGGLLPEPWVCPVCSAHIKVKEISLSASKRHHPGTPNFLLNSFRLVNQSKCVPVNFFRLKPEAGPVRLRVVRRGFLRWPLSPLSVLSASMLRLMVLP